MRTRSFDPAARIATDSGAFFLLFPLCGYYLLPSARDAMGVSRRTDEPSEMSEAK